MQVLLSSYKLRIVIKCSRFIRATKSNKFYILTTYERLNPRINHIQRVTSTIIRVFKPLKEYKYNNSGLKGLQDAFN